MLKPLVNPLMMYCVSVSLECRCNSLANVSICSVLTRVWGLVYV